MGGHGGLGMATEEVGSNTLLIMILQKIEHVVAKFIGLLPLARDV